MLNSKLKKDLVIKNSRSHNSKQKVTENNSTKNAGENLFLQFIFLLFAML